LVLYDGTEEIITTEGLPGKPDYTKVETRLIEKVNRPSMILPSTLLKVIVLKNYQNQGSGLIIYNIRNAEHRGLLKLPKF
jgi:hypothetical protein